MISKTDYLTQLHCLTDGDWHETYDNLRKRYILTDEENAKSLDLMKNFEKEGGWHFVNLEEAEYPKELYKVYRPYLAIQYNGDLSALGRYIAAEHRVFVEDNSISAMLARYDIPHASVSDHSTVFYELVSPDGVPVVKEVLRIYENESSSYERYGIIADVVVATEATAAFRAAMETAIDCNTSATPHFLALPGNSGCETNKLIKSHKWTLCDSGHDIKEILLGKPVTAIKSIYKTKKA